MNYYALAFYQIAPIESPESEVKLQKAFLKDKDAKARIYISEEGINGQMSLSKTDAKVYMDWMHSRELFKSIDFKLHEIDEHAFPKLTVKVRKQLVALDRPVDFSLIGEHISPAEFKSKLDKGNYTLLDVRNKYECEVGRFKGSIVPPSDTFREFDEWADELKTNLNPEKEEVLMCCTGGIRCEYFSALLKEKGFQNVKQLDGGIIGYGLKEGSKHWDGKLFVFDDRLTVPISNEPTEVIGKCHKCHAPTELYYNCANMDCNHLFLSCHECIKESIGCCKDTCQTAPRVRAFDPNARHKPFRKLDKAQKT
ncbi:MAG: rhodanese-related sulfurtransferase [Chlamydiia bacterium]|nr:rhodanese-related sulfurtransferase [Chlamydiia bacterium]